MVKMYAFVIYVFVSTTILMELFVCMLDGKTKGRKVGVWGRHDRVQTQTRSGEPLR